MTHIYHMSEWCLGWVENGMVYKEQQQKDNADPHLLRRGWAKLTHTEKVIQKRTFSRGWWCIYPSAWEVAAKGSGGRGHYQPRSEFEASLNCIPPCLKKKQKTTNNNKTKAPTTTNPQNKKGKQRLPQLAFTSRVTFYGWVKSWVWFRGLQTDSSWCACLTGAIIIKRKRHLPFNYKTGIFFLITNITKFTTINLKKMSGACPSNRGTGLKPRLPSPCPSWQGCSMEM